MNYGDQRYLVNPREDEAVERTPYDAAEHFAKQRELSELLPDDVKHLAAYYRGDALRSLIATLTKRSIREGVKSSRERGLISDGQRNRRRNAIMMLCRQLGRVCPLTEETTDEQESDLVAELRRAAYPPGYIEELNAEDRKVRGGARPIVDPAGRVFASMKVAAKFYDVPVAYISEEVADDESPWHFQKEETGPLAFARAIEASDIEARSPRPIVPKRRGVRPGRAVISPDGTLYDSIAEAARAVGLSEKAVSLRVARRSEGWRRYGEEPGRKPWDGAKKPRPVIGPGEVRYDSVYAAAAVVGLSVNTLWVYAKKEKHGWRWASSDAGESE